MKSKRRILTRNKMCFVVSDEETLQSINLAIEALEMQEKIHEIISEIDRKYDNYDVMLIIEVKDILNELIID